jgi:hypothetical protein
MLTVMCGSAVYQVTPGLATSTLRTKNQNTLKPEWLDKI